ncbi:HD domain-containing protein [Anatilimnocola aggregata]|nr:HD domain-containing protein [Anatilimnocola aggregata]
MRSMLRENLTYDPIHGYLPFVSGTDLPADEVAERQLIDHPWLQRMRQIHQLQTAWWVFPAAEHSRFPHVLGAMHLGSRAIAQMYDSLQDSCADTPSRGLVECTVRLAGLLHDVGHGPFGHFFDEHFLKAHGLTHESLGAAIIERELADLIRGIRRNPHSELLADEQIDPAQIAWLIQRPKPQDETTERPKWLVFLRGLLSGIYTIDNMDFVLRDAALSGYSKQAFDLDRLLHYTFFSERGLTIHDRGSDALVRFVTVRAELFRNIYYHRTVRAIDFSLRDLFNESKQWLFPGNPLEHLDDYLYFTESTLWADVQRWAKSSNPQLADLGTRWRALLARKIEWQMVCQRSQVYAPNDAEQASIFSDAELVERKLRQLLPSDLQQIPLRIDIARTILRPNTSGPAMGQNFLYDSARRVVRPLVAEELYRRLPISHRLCRIYAKSLDYAPIITTALDQLVGGPSGDDATNM